MDPAFDVLVYHDKCSVYQSKQKKYNNYAIQ